MKKFTIKYQVEGETAVKIEEFDSHFDYLKAFTRIKQDYVITSEETKSDLILERKPDLFSDYDR